MKRSGILISILIAFFGFSASIGAQDTLVSSTYRVLENPNGITGPKQTSEFQVSSPGIVRFEAVATPYISCGKAGHQYVGFQYRAKNSSGNWINGAPGFREHTGVTYSPQKWVEGKRLSWTWQWEVLPQAENYKFRVLLVPVACWTGVGHMTPEQALAISAVFLSQTTGHQSTQVTWATQADGLRGRNGQRFTYNCPPGSISSRLWGTDQYTDDSSICTAAVHAGAITARSGGAVTIEIRGGANSYRGSYRNGISSKDYGVWHGSFVVVNGVAGNNSGDATPITWATQADAWRGQNGRRYKLRCPSGGTISSRLWGTDVYTDDSSICTAAAHAGWIGRSGGSVTIEIRGGQSSYRGTSRNGVTSQSYGAWHGSFAVIGN